MHLHANPPTINQLVVLGRFLLSPRHLERSRRAAIIWCSVQGLSVAQIARLGRLPEELVGRLIRQYNAQGLLALNGPLHAGRPASRSTDRHHPTVHRGHGESSIRGRPTKLTLTEQLAVVNTATTPPQNLGLPFREWSLRKLRDHLVRNGLVQPVSHTTIAAVLRRHRTSCEEPYAEPRSPVLSP